MAPFSFSRPRRSNVIEPHDSNETMTPTHDSLSKMQIRRATRTRKIACIITCVLLFICVIFLIMVEIGNINKMSALTNIYFIKLNLSDVRGIAVTMNRCEHELSPDRLCLQAFRTPTFWTQSLRHWGCTIFTKLDYGIIAKVCRIHGKICSPCWWIIGYADTGVSDCVKPQALYWFNPVEIIVNQLISGASSRSFQFPLVIILLIDCPQSRCRVTLPTSWTS